MSDVVRQSQLAAHDACALQAYFARKYEHGWSTHAQARGTLLHRFFAEGLRAIREQDFEYLPVEIGLAIFEDVMRQNDVPAAERVRVPLSEIPQMRMAAIKFCHDNAWTVRNIVAVERRLQAALEYRRPDGTLVQRTISGQPDLLIAQPPATCVCVDFKTGWGTPPESSISPLAYPQQRVYSFLVLRTYPSVQTVVLREMYVYRTQTREALLTRDDLPELEHWLSVLVEDYDRALGAGDPPDLELDTLRDYGLTPSPGLHCRYCAHSERCPVDDAYSVGGIRTQTDAERAAAARQVARAVDRRMTALCRSWVDLNGPIRVRSAKASNLVLGYRPIANGKLRFGEYSPAPDEREAA